ncbi:hypothetical protein AB0E96_35710 [Kitasatospora sp. NPDC036755]|uniref:hypothetical protein n=1 Tax=Kitasatospora sp. NPDC036755 TaxID=3154600 RepID=UPI00340467D9
MEFPLESFAGRVRCSTSVRLGRRFVACAVAVPRSSAIRQHYRHRQYHGIRTTPDLFPMDEESI